MYMLTTKTWPECFNHTLGKSPSTHTKNNLQYVIGISTMCREKTSTKHLQTPCWLSLAKKEKKEYFISLNYFIVSVQTKWTNLPKYISLYIQLLNRMFSLLCFVNHVKVLKSKYNHGALKHWHILGSMYNAHSIVTPGK